MRQKQWMQLQMPTGKQMQARLQLLRQIKGIVLNVKILGAQT
jgi:hypothetical protein